MTQIQLTSLDWAVLAAYLAVIVLVGVLAARKIKDTQHYFLGGRRFGKLVMIGQTFSTGTHAEMPVSLAGAVYTTGASAIWYQWKNLFATPFYWLMAPLFRRMRRTTTAEVVEDRYGPWMGALYTVFALAYFTIGMASMLKGAAKVISQAAGGGVPVDQIVVGMTCVFVLYSLVGGLVAVAWADVFQGLLIITLSFMLIPLGWEYAGGLDGMRQALPPEMFSLQTPRGIGLWFILMLTVNGLIGIAAQPHILASVGTGKDEHSCRVGFLYGSVVKRVCTIGWTLVGLLVAALVLRGTFGVTSLGEPEEAFGFACRRLLFPGGLGLLIACILAANMAASSAYMVDSSALFTRNFYRKYLVRAAADQHYLRAGRASGIAMTGCGVLYAVFLIDRVLYSFLLTETLATYVGISVVGGVFWRRANRWGALASLVVAMATNFALYAARGQRLDHWDPTVFFVALLAGVAALIVVSLLTPPESHAAVDDYFARLHTPSDSFWPERKPGDPPPDPHLVSKAGRQLLLLNLANLRAAARPVGFFRAYREDLSGFAIAWAIAIALVVLVWGILRL
jgi:Na+/proline symporter